MTDVPHGGTPNPGDIAREFDHIVDRGEQTLLDKETYVDAMRSYLERLSKDSEGSSPCDFFDPTEVAIIEDFVDQYANYVCPDPKVLVPGKKDLNLRQSASGKKIWGKDAGNIYPGLHLKKGLVEFLESGSRYRKVKLEADPTWEGQGYLIGQLNASLMPNERDGGNHTGYEDVYLCTDGKLRCTRTFGVFSDSFAVGVGTLPFIINSADNGPNNPRYFVCDDSFSSLKLQSDIRATLLNYAIGIKKLRDKYSAVI